jgi:hypothetical protein
VSTTYPLPTFLNGKIERAVYIRWLDRKADAHAKRDRKRFNREITIAGYKQLIHKAVCQSNCTDWYTGEQLEWEKISTYDNDQSKTDRSKYKALFARLPTVDHVFQENGGCDFVICGWRTNDAKNDLSYSDFVALCQRVLLRHQTKTEAASDL